MERNQNQKTSLKQTFSTQNLVMMAVLAAMQIILARFLGIQASDTLRISFESIPVVLAGLWLGPVCGAVVGFIADAIGTILSGLPWFPPLALNPIMEGLVAGLCARYFIREGIGDPRCAWKVSLTALLTGILSSFGVGLVGSTLYSIMMKGNTTAFPVLLWTNLLTRLGTKPWTIAVNIVVITIVNRAVYKPVVKNILSRA